MSRLTSLGSEFANVVNQRLNNVYLKSETMSRQQIENRIANLVNAGTLTNVRANTIWCEGDVCTTDRSAVQAKGPFRVRANGGTHMLSKANQDGALQFAIEADDNQLNIVTHNDQGGWSGRHPISVRRNVENGTQDLIRLNGIVETSNGIVVQGDGFRHLIQKRGQNGVPQINLEVDDNQLQVATFTNDGSWTGRHPFVIRRNAAHGSQNQDTVVLNATVEARNGIYLGDGYRLEVRDDDGQRRLCITRNGRILAAFHDGQDTMRVRAGNNRGYMYVNNQGFAGVHDTPFPGPFRV